MPARDAEQTKCDAESFEAAFRTYYVRLVDFVDGYVRSREQARDLVQDLFVNLWERCEAGDLPPLRSAYLYTAARNRALKYLRHHKVASRWAERAMLEPLPTGPRSDDDVRALELADAIQQAIHAMPDRRREVFLLSREQDLSYAAIAETLGISVKTVEEQMWRALKSLRKSLAPYLAVAVAQLTHWGHDLFR